MKSRSPKSKTQRAKLARSPPQATPARQVTILSDLREALNQLAAEVEASRLLGGAVTALARRPGYERLEADLREEMRRIAAAPID